MYSAIENKFKKKALNKKINTLSNIIACITTSVYICFFIIIRNNVVGILILSTGYILGTSIVFLMCAYVYQYIIINKEKVENRGSFINFKKNMLIYNKFVHDNDIKLLKSIYDAYNINTSEKLSEVLRHYQSKKTKSVSPIFDITSAISLTTAMVSFVIDIENKNIIYVIKIIMIIIIIGYSLHKIFNLWKLSLWKYNIDEMLEELTAEFYMKMHRV